MIWKLAGAQRDSQAPGNASMSCTRALDTDVVLGPLADFGVVLAVLEDFFGGFSPAQGIGG